MTTHAHGGDRTGHVVGRRVVQRRGRVLRRPVDVAPRARALQQPLHAREVALAGRRRQRRKPIRVGHVDERVVAVRVRRGAEQLQRGEAARGAGLVRGGAAEAVARGDEGRVRVEQRRQGREVAGARGGKQRRVLVAGRRRRGCGFGHGLVGCRADGAARVCGETVRARAGASFACAGLRQPISRSQSSAFVQPISLITSSVQFLRVVITASRKSPSCEQAFPRSTPLNVPILLFSPPLSFPIQQ